MVSAMRFGGRTAALAIVILALAGQLVQGQAPPSSRNVGYTVSVDLTKPLGSVARRVKVLESNLFMVYLEGDDVNKCSLSVREKYTGRGDPALSPGRGYLLWSANYYARTPAGADKCTLKFTSDGDLQLWITYRGATTLTWSSNTAGKGVTKMALQTTPSDDGNFQLLARTTPVFQSFDKKEWLVLNGQKFMSWDMLKSPDQVYNENDTIVLANSGRYIMAFKNGDLQLLINGPKPQVYWSLKGDLNVKKDLSNVQYAAIAKDDDEGVGLYTAGGSLVYRIAVPPWVPNYGADEHFGLDYYGNLQYFLMYKGLRWDIGWSAILDPCRLPGFCGNYGLCTSSIDEFGGVVKLSCACPSGFKKAGALDSAGCVRTSSLSTKCNHTKYKELSGYGSAYLRYVTPTTVQSASACKVSCSSDCKCDGVFYKAQTHACYKVDQVLTLTKNTTGAGTVAFIKVK